jgi:hypothetical protein
MADSRSPDSYLSRFLSVLDPEIRCFALVGEFLRAWSLMESALQDAIAAALDIEGLKAHILCANMRFRDKLHVIASLVYVADPFSYDERQNTQKNCAPWLTTPLTEI